MDEIKEAVLTMCRIRISEFEPTEQLWERALKEAAAGQWLTAIQILDPLLSSRWSARDDLAMMMARAGLSPPSGGERFTAHALRALAREQSRQVHLALWDGELAAAGYRSLGRPAPALDAFLVSCRAQLRGAWPEDADLAAEIPRPIGATDPAGLDAVIAALPALLSLGAPAASVQMSRASMLLDAERPEEALPLVRSITDYHPESRLAWLLTARALGADPAVPATEVSDALRRAFEGARDVEDFVCGRPIDAELRPFAGGPFVWASLLVELWSSLREAQHHTEAEVVARRIVEVAGMREGGTWLGLTLVDLGRFEESRKAYDTAIASFEESSEYMEDRFAVARIRVPFR